MTGPAAETATAAAPSPATRPADLEPTRASLKLSRDEWLSVALLSALAAALYWPNWELVPGAFLDGSWGTALSWAIQNGLHWGPDLTFTWGPLGVLDFPLATHRGQVAVSSAVWLIEVFVLLVLLYQLVRPRNLPRFAALGIAGVCAGILLTPVANFAASESLNILVPITFAACALALTSRSAIPIVVAGVAVGVLGQEKLSDAVIAAGVAVACAYGSRAWRGLALFAGVAVATWLAAWVVAGQPLADLATHITRSMEIIRGHVQAMAIEQPGLAWQYVAAAILVPLVAIQAWIAARTCGARVRLAVLSAVIFALWFGGHEAFIRHDRHGWYFFGIVVELCLFLLLAQPAARRFMPGLVAGVAAFLVVSMFWVPLLAVIDRQASLQSLSTTLGVMASADRAASLTAERNGQYVSLYHLTPELIATLGTAPTAVDPVDVSALSPTSAQWYPLPVFQAYLAYTPALDQVNADALLAHPRQILRSKPYPAIDGRNPIWESPKVQRILYCRYDVVFETPGWQVLRPSGADRCAKAPGPAGGSVDAQAGQAIPVPHRDGSITLATITPARSALTQLVELVLKSRPVHVTYGPATWRLPDNPSAVELMLNGPVAHPAFPNLPAAPFETITVSAAAHVEFEFIDVRAPSAP